MMTSAVLDRGTKRNSACTAGSCGGTPIIPVSCACCRRVLVKEEGVPRVLTGPAKKIKLEFDAEPFIKKEAPEPCSPAPKPCSPAPKPYSPAPKPAQQHQNLTQKRGGEKIVFKDEDLDDGNKSEKESTLSLPSSDNSFNFPKPKADFGQFKQPFKTNYRGGSRYTRPHYYRNNNYRNNSNRNAYAGNNMQYHNNSHFGGFRGGFSNAPLPVLQQILNQHLNGASVPPRPPLAIKQSFSPFSAHIKTPPCSPLPPKPAFHHPPSSPSVKSNVMSSVIPDPPRGSSPAASQTGRSWWKASEWPRKSSDSCAPNPSNNGSGKLNMSSSSVPVSEIPPPRNMDKPQTKTFIGQDHGLLTQRASCNAAGGTVAKSRLTADQASDGDLCDDDFCDGEDDQAFADNVVDDKDWIEELALEAVIPVKALCSSCLHTSDPKPEDGNSANADIEILFNSCDIQICSEEGSVISSKGSRRRSRIFNNTVEVVDINDCNDDVQDISPEIHKTLSKRKLFVQNPNNGDAFNAENRTDNTDIVDLIEDEEENDEHIEEIGRTGENDPNLVRPSDPLLEVLDIGEDIVLDEVCSNGVKGGGSCSPGRVNELAEEEQEQSGDWNDQDAASKTAEEEEPSVADERVEQEAVVEACDINMEVGEELTVPSESTTGVDTEVEHPTELSQSENRAGEAAVVSNEAWDEVLREMQEVGDEVEELVDLDVQQVPSSLQRPEEGDGRSEHVGKFCDQGKGDQEIEVCDQGSGDQDQESEVIRSMGNISEPSGSAGEIQCVGGDVTALAVPSEVVESSVVSTGSDYCEEVTTVEKGLEDNSSSVSCRKMIATKASGLVQPRTPRKLTRSSVTSTPVRLTRSLRPSSLLSDSNTCTDDATIVDESTQLATYSSSSRQSTPSQSYVLPDKSIATPSRRSNRRTKNDPNVSLRPTVTNLDGDGAQSDLLKLGSTHEHSVTKVEIAPSSEIKARLSAPTRAMLKQMTHKPGKYLPIIAEASCSNQDSEGGVGRVTRRSVAASHVAGVQRVDLSSRSSVLAGSERGAAPAKEPSKVAHRGKVMTRRSVLGGSATVPSLKNVQLAGSDQAVPSADGISEDGEDRGDDLCSQYDLDYDEDRMASEVKSNEEDKGEKSGKDVPVVEDDDVTCLD